MISSSRTLRLGTRGSLLALEQARQVAGALDALAPQLQLDTHVISTSGDRDKQTPLKIIGGQGIFVKALQEALLSGEVDLTVHSAKDLPTEIVPGLVIGAFTLRDDPRDVLVSRDGQRLAELPAGARVGTSSQRRVMALRTLRPDLRPVELRGNIDTRLRRVREGEVDAAILAAAGVRRMGWADQITEYLPLETFVPSPGQAALAVECRADDAMLVELLARLSDPPTALAVQTERTFLREIGGGCRAPIGVHATVDGEALTLRAMLGDEALTRVRFLTRTAPVAEAEALAREMASELQRAVDEPA